MTVRVYQVNDMEWWAGDCTAEELLDFYMNHTGCTREESTGDANGLPQELDAAALDALKVRYFDSDDGPTGEMITFREHLNNLIGQGQEFPCLFAVEGW